MRKWRGGWLGRVHGLQLVGTRNRNSSGRDGGGGSEATDGEEERQRPEAGRRRFRKRSSDPQTLRERESFRRDLKYGRARPLADAPWRELPNKTYLDDAERLYGRKETWHLCEDEALREKLVSTMQDFLSDTVSATQLEIRDAHKYRRLCNRCAEQYRSVVAAEALSERPGFLLSWAKEILEGREAQAAPPPPLPSSTPTTDDDGASAPGASMEMEEEDTGAEHRRRRPRDVSGSVAMSGVPDADLRHPPQSAFPFLRKRAVEDGGSLDPSLVDWTAKYFPEDSAETFREPPQLRRPPPAPTQRQQQNEPGDSVQGEEEEERGRGSAPPPRVRTHARRRLRRSLREHDSSLRPTFDGEGVFYHVRGPNSDDEPAPKARPVRGSEAPAGEVVKVPWDVVANAKRQGYDSDILRARERLTRLSRGEDPSSIP